VGAQGGVGASHNGSSVSPSPALTPSILDTIDYRPLLEEMHAQSC